LHTISIPTLSSVLIRIGPVVTVAVSSIFLSLIAISATVTPNNDGMAYIEAARLYQQGGTEAAASLFNWNSFTRTFIAVAIAWMATITGLWLENAAYLLCIDLIRGICVLLLACSEEMVPVVG